MIYSTLIIILIIIAMIYLLEDRLIYAPTVSTYQDSKKILKFKTKSNHIISAIYIPKKGAKYTVLINHGNAEDIGSIYSFLHEWHYRNFNVLAYDYPGYGTSSGKATFTSNRNAANTAYNFLTQGLEIPDNQIIVYGRSIGAAIAIELTMHKPIAGLILDSPFVSAFRVLTRIPLLPFDQYNNLKKIKHIHCPVLIIHGKQDQVVPCWHGEMLYRVANKPKEFLSVEKAGHKDLNYIASDTYWEKVKTFIKKHIS